MTNEWDSPTRSSILEDIEYLHKKMREDNKRIHLPLHERDPGAYHEKHLLYVLLMGRGDPPGLKARCPVCGWIRSSSALPGVTIALTNRESSQSDDPQKTRRKPCSLPTA